MSDKEKPKTPVTAAAATFSPLVFNVILSPEDRALFQRLVEAVENMARDTERMAWGPTKDNRPPVEA